MLEPPVDQLISVVSAIDILDHAPVFPRIESILLSNAHSRTLAKPILADRDYPPFDRSLMDGFAVMSDDVGQGIRRFSVVGSIAAGQMSDKTLRSGQAMKIMTGAPLPAGADGVVPVEDTHGGSEPGKWSDADFFELMRAGEPRRFVSRRGSECAANAEILSAGARLTPAALAAAATAGAASVSVFARPTVSIVTTGDEIIPFDQTPSGSEIRNSNSILLASLLQQAGCEVLIKAHAPDDPQKIRRAISAAPGQLIFVSGGMSMGEHDHVPGVLRECGFDLPITKLRIKPGKPFAFGIANNSGNSSGGSRFAFGLPGNPVSAFVCTTRLAMRIIRRLQGQSPEPAWRVGRLTAALPANGPREFYQPVQVEEDRITPLGWKGSADVFTLARARGLLIRGENSPAIEVGSVVRVMEV